MARKAFVNVNTPLPESKLQYTEHRDNPNLNVFECGWERCLNTHCYGPTKRTYYILHFIVDGFGRYEIDGKSMRLGKGDIFLIPPDVTTFYAADSRDPWRYFWVGFNGIDCPQLLQAAGFTNGVYTVHADKFQSIENIMRNLTSFNERGRAAECGMLGYLYVLFSELIHERIEYASGTESDAYVSQAIRFINSHYAESIDINDVVYMIGVDRTYFYRLFKKKMGVSPKEYLVNIRLEKALVLMHDTKLTLKEIAQQVGYDSYDSFLRIFKRKKGFLPTQFLWRPLENNNGNL